jgi:hypothetical protein
MRFYWIFVWVFSFVQTVWQLSFRSIDFKFLTEKPVTQIRALFVFSSRIYFCASFLFPILLLD